MKLSFSEKKLLEGGPVVVHYSGNRASDGQPLFVYLLLDKERLEALHRDIEEKDSLVFADYGRVLHSGYGEATEEDEQAANEAAQALADGMRGA